MEHLLTWHGEIHVCSENTKQYTVKFLKRSSETWPSRHVKAAQLKIDHCYVLMYCYHLIYMYFFCLPCFFFASLNILPSVQLLVLFPFEWLGELYFYFFSSYIYIPFIL